MFLDEKGRLFSKVSIVDIAVAIFLICAILFVGLKFFAPPGNVNSAEETAYEYTFKVENIRQASVDALKKSEGMSVYDSEGAFLGTVKEIVSVKPYETAVVKSDGTMVQAEVPDKYTVKAAVEVTAKKTTDSIMVSNKREISVGNHMSITTPEITVEVVITSVNAK